MSGSSAFHDNLRNVLADRKNATAAPDVAFDPAAGPPRGILRRDRTPAIYGHERRVPSAELTKFILHYWMVQWDLPREARETVETIPHPNIQLVFTGGDCNSILIHGVQTTKFTRVLAGNARVFGAKFRAGGFRGFFDGPVAKLRDRTMDATEVFPGISELAALLTGNASRDEKMSAANRYLLERSPKNSGEAEIAASAVDLILKNPAIVSVSGLCKFTGIRERTLQRLFRGYVGVGPKWVIRRYRLHELVEILNSGAEVDWAATAAALGYFDQSHLIQDFRRIAGYAPEQYRRM